MGLSKSKQMKPGQQGGQPGGVGFPGGQPGGFPNQQFGFGGPAFPGAQPPGQNNGFPSTAGFPLPGGGFPSSQVGYPGFPPAPPSFASFPPNQLFPQSSSFPVSYPSQQFRPLVPGYAPAPPHDRRSNVLGQEQDQGEFRFFDQQMPPMHQGGKQRKQH